MRLSVNGPRKPEKSEARSEERRSKMEEEKRLERKGAREEERKKREMEEEGEVKSQQKKRKVSEETPPSYWDWLPPELQAHIEKKALQGLIQDRLDRGFKQIYEEMATLPRCCLHGTVS